MSFIWYWIDSFTFATEPDTTVFAADVTIDFAADPTIAGTAALAALALADANKCMTILSQEISRSMNDFYLVNLHVLSSRTNANFFTSHCFPFRQMLKMNART